MPDIWMDVDAALAGVPVNLMPLVDDTDFKTRETAVAHNAAGLDLVWNFCTTAGAMTQTAVVPTTGGDYDWAHQGDGMYTIEIPASGGASVNNDAEGFGWFTGVATGVYPWRGPVIGFRAAGLNDALIDGAYSVTQGLAGTHLDAAVSSRLASAGYTAPDNAGIGSNGTAIGALNDLDSAAVQAAANAALVALHLDHLLAEAYSAVSKPGNALSLFNSIMVNDGGSNRLSANLTAILNHGMVEITGGRTANNWLGFFNNDDAASTKNLDDVGGGGGGLTAQQVRDAMKLAPSAGDPVDGSIDDHLDDLLSYTPAAGAIEVTDIVIDDGSNPLEGAEVWLTTDSAGNNVVWLGVTDSNGNPKDTANNNPFLDTGTYYVWAQLGGYTFANPTTKAVS